MEKRRMPRKRYKKAKKKTLWRTWQEIRESRFVYMLSTKLNNIGDACETCAADADKRWARIDFRLRLFLFSVACLCAFLEWIKDVIFGLFGGLFGCLFGGLIRGVVWRMICVIVYAVLLPFKFMIWLFCMLVGSLIVGLGLESIFGKESGSAGKGGNNVE